MFKNMFSAKNDDTKEPLGFEQEERKTPWLGNGYRSDGRGFEITAVMEDPECIPDESKNGYDITMGREGNYCMYRIIKK